MTNKTCHQNRTVKNSNCNRKKPIISYFYKKSLNKYKIVTYTIWMMIWINSLQIFTKNIGTKPMNFISMLSTQVFASKFVAFLLVKYKNLNLMPNKKSFLW